MSFFFFFWERENIRLVMIWLSTLGRIQNWKWSHVGLVVFGLFRAVQIPTFKAYIYVGEYLSDTPNDYSNPKTFKMSFFFFDSNTPSVWHSPILITSWTLVFVVFLVAYTLTFLTNYYILSMIGEYYHVHVIT